MKTILKYVGYLIAFVLLVIVGALSYVKLALPNVGESEDLKIDYTTERIERGRYLANTVTVCMDCHSKRDWSKFSGPLAEGTLGMGGDVFDQSMVCLGYFMPGIFHLQEFNATQMVNYFG